MPGDAGSLSMERVRELVSKKATFEEGVRVLTRAVESEVAAGGGGKRKEILASVNRVASLLKTRYSAPGPWSAGLRLFQAAQPLADADAALRNQLQGHVEAAQEVVGKLQEEDEAPAAPAASARRPAPYHFQGQLSVGSEPPPRLPTLPGLGPLGPEAEAMLLQALAQAASAGPDAFSGLGIPVRPASPTGEAGRQGMGTRPRQGDRGGEAQEETEEGEEGGEGEEEGEDERRRRGRREGSASAEPGGTTGGPEAALPLPAAAIESMLASLMGAAGEGFPGLEEAIEASLQQGVAPPTAPPASKKEVEKLPTFQVPTQGVGATLARGRGAEGEGPGCTGGDSGAADAVRPENSFCTVCQEDWREGDLIREMPCTHQFHVDCLQPWLDQHNSCPMCRYEMKTDDEVYERRKEREKEAEEERAGAANAVREGVYMYL